MMRIKIFSIPFHLETSEFTSNAFVFNFKKNAAVTQIKSANLGQKQ